MATDIVTRTGKSAALSAADNDQNLESLSGTVDAKTADYTVVYTDQNKTIEFNRASAVTCNMTAIATILAAIDTTNFRVKIKNIGAGTCTIDPSGVETVDGATTYALVTDDSVELQVDGAGTNWSVITGHKASAIASSGTLTSGDLLSTDGTNATNSGLQVNKTPQIDTTNTWDLAQTFTTAPVLPADSVDAITEIAAAIKTGADTKLCTGTAGTSGDVAEWNADGDLIGTRTPGGTASGDLVTINDTQTLTAKTLASPTIDLSTITSAGDLAIADGGTGASDAPTARTNLGVTTFTSSQFTLTVNGFNSFSHGLGGLPTTIQMLVECTTAEYGYAIGDWATISNSDTAVADMPPTVFANTTTIGVQTADTLRILDRTSGSEGAIRPITLSSWKGRLIATRIG